MVGNEPCNSNANTNEPDLSQESQYRLDSQPLQPLPFGNGSDSCLENVERSVRDGMRRRRRSVTVMPCLFAFPSSYSYSWVDIPKDNQIFCALTLGTTEVPSHPQHRG